MNIKDRILLECRYLLSINKSYRDIANRLNITEDMVYDDLNNKLLLIDSILYKRVQKVLQKNK